MVNTDTLNIRLYILTIPTYTKYAKTIRYEARLLFYLPNSLLRYLYKTINISCLTLPNNLTQALNSYIKNSLNRHQKHTNQSLFNHKKYLIHSYNLHCIFAKIIKKQRMT